MLLRPYISSEDKSIGDAEMKVLLSLSMTITVCLEIHTERLHYTKTTCLIA